MSTENGAETTEQDTCRAIEIDGETARVRGAGNPSPEATDAIAAVVRAARDRMEAEDETASANPWHGTSPISAQAVEDACRANWDSRVHASGCGVLWNDYAPAQATAMHPYREHMRAALEAAYPAIRQQVAQEIATAIEDVANSLRESANTTRQRSIDTGGRTTAEGDQLMTIALNRNNRAGGFRDAAYLAREIGGAE